MSTRFETDDNTKFTIAAEFAKKYSETHHIPDTWIATLCEKLREAINPEHAVRLLEIEAAKLARKETVAEARARVLAEAEKATDNLILDLQLRRGSITTDDLVDLIALMRSEDKMRRRV